MLRLRLPANATIKRNSRHYAATINLFGFNWLPDSCWCLQQVRRIHLKQNNCNDKPLFAVRLRGFLSLFSGCTASVLVAHTLNAHSTVFLFGFEAPKSSLDGLNAQLPLFMSIYNQDVIGMDWNASIGTSRRQEHMAWLFQAICMWTVMKRSGAFRGLRLGLPSGFGVWWMGIPESSSPTHPDSPMVPLPCGWWTSSLL